MFLQMPFLYILFDVIKGLTATTKSGVVSPRYIPKPANLHAALHGANVPLIDKMYVNLIHAKGQLRSFGMNFALKPFSHHGSVAAAIPYFVLVVVAVGLGYMPIIFGYIYFIVPAAVVIYMIVSTTIRIATQDIMFRTGVVQPVNAERAISGAKGGASSSSSGVVDVVAKETKASPKPAPKANGATRPGATKPAIGAGAQSKGSLNGGVG